MRLRWWMLLTALLALLCFPPHWYPQAVRLQLAEMFGAGSYKAPPGTKHMAPASSESPCAPDLSNWRDAQSIEGVSIRGAETCSADNPHAIAAFVRGTNNVSSRTLMESGLTPDAVEKGRDLDGDGDPDEIHIRLEVVELNGASPESQEPVTQYEIAPGIKPGFWVFVPKRFGMDTENFESVKARALLRVPSPAIRIEQGDRVKITLENGHYMPHTVHFHGVDHTFVDANGEGNDGVPLVSEMPVMPGKARTYDLSPRVAGTKFYHCHVQPHVHVMMGLQGLFVVEENRPNNWLQTLNVGAGQVRAPSQAIKAEFDQEYDLHYLDVDADLNNRIQRFNDPRLITESMHRRYDITDATSDYYLLNGRSFPYTFRESLVVVKPNQKVKLRVANGGSNGIALHTHGHTVTVTHRDGHPVDPVAQTPRDVEWIASAQRVDLLLDTTDDGTHSYGSGIWLFHDHQNRGVTNDGIAPGGNISAIVYADYMNETGWPNTLGVSFDPYFTEAYYRRETPVWESYAPGLFGEVKMDSWAIARLIGFVVSCSLFFVLLLIAWRRRHQ